MRTLRPAGVEVAVGRDGTPGGARPAVVARVAGHHNREERPVSPGPVVVATGRPTGGAAGLPRAVVAHGLLGRVRRPGPGVDGVGLVDAGRAAGLRDHDLVLGRVGRHVDDDTAADPDRQGLHSRFLLYSC